MIVRVDAMDDLGNQVNMHELTEQITREYEREQRGSPLAVDPGDIPISYEAITDEWLTHILCKDHPGARVIDHRLDLEDDGNTNRRRIFLAYNDVGNAAGLPPSVFCKALQKLPNRLVDAAVGLIEGEDTFYNHFRPLLDIEAPKSYFATYDRQSFNSIVILNDLVHEGAEFCRHDTNITRRRIESQLALLAKMHGKFYGRMDDDPLTAGLRTWEDKFNFSNAWFNLERCCTNGFLAAEEVVPARLFARNAEIWPATLKSNALHATQPRTLTHNDPHLRNWYIAANGEMGLADWQCICRADWGRDVAYTISTALTVDARRLWEKELLRFYLDRLRAEGCPALDFDEVFTNYRRHLFSALAYWTVTLTPSTGKSSEPAPAFQPVDATLEFIKRMTTAIDDLDSLESFD